MIDLIDKEVRGYKFIKLIGKGAFGFVFQGKVLKDKRIVAIKVIEIERFQENDGILGELVLSEQKALQKVKSKYVVGFVDCFMDNLYSYLVMEYCDSGDLEQQIKNPNLSLTEQDAIGILRQILSGLKDLHSTFIIHRDLKAANILIQSRSIYKIADLGFCKMLQNENDQSRLQLGSLYTMAPEILNQNSYGLSSDMFSVGVIFYQILFGRYPFTQKDYKSQSQPQINFNKNKIDVSDEAKDLIVQMLQFDPKKRITFLQISQHKVFQKQIFSQISRIQIESSKLDLEENVNFYQQQANIIEQENQKDIQTTQQRLLTNKQQPQRDVQFTQSIKNLQIDEIPFQDKSNLDNDLKQKIKKTNEMNLKIEELNRRMNDIYYFSNTILEIFQIQMRAHYAAVLLCYQVKKMNNLIQIQILEQISIVKDDNDYQNELNQLNNLLELAGQQYIISELQFEDIAYQQNLSGDKRIQEMLKNQLDQYNLNNNLYQEIDQIIKRENNQITYAIYHLIICCQYCFMLNKPVNPIQLDNNNFNIQKSKQLYPNQAEIRLKFQKIVEDDKNQY
ncbi:unnamed protein product [Paramecium sonneborni]|uniref:Protein kinase domain-containing protein n=1 Tax=Paramecium sonneborni TaxID=65129 RepID=A0A8S1JZ22_9CILI|nr:unnamed protein product [Paramecium sonneborni]